MCKISFAPLGLRLPNDLLNMILWQASFEALAATLNGKTWLIYTKAKVSKDYKKTAVI